MVGLASEVLIVSYEKRGLMLNDEKVALSAVEEWVREFHKYGDKFDCIEILHDGYAEDDDGNEIKHEHCYAVFVNSQSHLIDDFPPHEIVGTGMVRHRPDDFCIYAWLNEETESVFVNAPDREDAGLSWSETIKIILAIEKKYAPEERE